MKKANNWDGAIIAVHALNYSTIRNTSKSQMKMSSTELKKIYSFG